MDIFEQMAMGYLTKNGRVFVSPQYSIDRDWSCPDFVALDFERKRVWVVEVSAAWDVKGLASKVNDCERQWMSRLRDQLRQKGILGVDDGWSEGIMVFIRESRIEDFNKRLTRRDGIVVEIVPLEKAGVPWEWDWGAPLSSN